jgi:hypothetical protein
MHDPFRTLDGRAAETARWVLDQLRSLKSETDPALLQRFLAPAWRWPTDWLMQHWRTQVGDFEVRRVVPADDGWIEIEVQGRKERKWLVRLRLDDRDRLAECVITRAVPADITFRRARESDWAALAELERACPTVTAEGTESSVYRGERLRDHFALQGEYTIWVAEHRGRIVGARAFPVRDVVIDGTRRRYVFSHFVRILPDYQAMGLFQPLNSMAWSDIQANADNVFAYADPGNVSIRRALGNFPTWSVKPFRAELRCDTLAGERHGRPAQPRDADRVVKMINCCHQREGFFAPYSEEVLSERLSRVAHAYSWDQFRIAERAVVGVWPCNEWRRIEDGDRIETMRRAVVLDYGFTPGDGEDDFVRLLHHCCAQVREQGMTHLSVFSSPPSPGCCAIRELAERTQDFEFSFGEAEPPDLGSRGVYVDPVFF